MLSYMVIDWDLIIHQIFFDAKLNLYLNTVPKPKNSSAVIFTFLKEEDTVFRQTVCPCVVGTQ